MKTLRTITIIITLFSCTCTAIAQKYQLKASKTSFFSTTPVEDIEAQTKETKGIMDATAKTFFFKIAITSFVFKSDLMRDHFNENYMESEKYPHSTFKGKIEGTFDLTKEGISPVLAVGDLSIHGITKNVSIPSTITVKGGLTSIDSKFNVKLVDYNIKVPTVVFAKIAEVLEVKINAELEEIK